MRPFVEGLVKLDSLGDDQFEFDPVLLKLSGRRTGFTVSLGDKVNVVVQNVSVALKRIEFGLAISEEEMEIAASRAAKLEARGRSRKAPGGTRSHRKGKPAARGTSKPGSRAKAGSKSKPGSAVNHRGGAKKKSGGKASGKPKGGKPKGGKPAGASKPGKKVRRKKR